MSIMAEARPLRRGKSVDALKKVGDKNALILCTAARLFWAERKVEKARDWFARAVKVDGDQGDVWAWWIKFEIEHGTAVSLPCIIFLLDLTLSFRNINSGLLNSALLPIHIMASSGLRWPKIQLTPERRHERFF